MIYFLTYFVIKFLLLYLSIFVLSDVCSFKRVLKAEVNALYASFFKCIKIFMQSINFVLWRGLKTPGFHDCRN